MTISERLRMGVVYRHQQYDMPDHEATEATMDEAADTIDALVAALEDIAFERAYEWYPGRAKALARAALNKEPKP